MVTGQPQRPSAWEALARPDGDFLEGYLLDPGPTPTGVPPLDEALGGGLWPGVTVLAGGPGSCKTLVATWALVRMAEAGARPLMCALELSRQDVLTRMCAAWASSHGMRAFPWGRAVCPERFGEGREGYERAMRYARSADDPVIAAWRAMEASIGGGYAVADGIRSAGALSSTLSGLASEGWRGPVVVDYVQLMDAGSPGASEYERVTEASRELARLASALRLPVLALSSLKKLTARDVADGPSVDWLRGSGYLGYDASAVLFLASAENEGPGGVRRPRVTIAKSRHGRTGEVALSMQPWSGWVGR